MSDIQLDLALLGVVILLAVVGYNAWVMRKSAPRRAKELPTTHTPLGEAARQDPILDTSLDAKATKANNAASKVAERKFSLDALIDTITPLALEIPVSGDAILAALPSTRRVGSKVFAIEAQNQQTKSWELPKAGARYVAIQAGVQLANRHGALNEIEFSEFVMKVQALADTLGAIPDFPDMRHEVLRARELDQFATEHDAQLSFTVRAVQAAWSTGYIHQQAGLQGLVAGTLPGTMAMPNPEVGGAPLFTLSFDTQAALADDPEQTALYELNLVLDVTHVAQNHQPYARMREVATHLAKQMDGAVTDDQGQPITVAFMDQIASDLEHLYVALQTRDLTAGSTLARRLFS